MTNIYFPDYKSRHRPTAPNINHNFNLFERDYNGGIDNSNVSTTADIDGDALADATVYSRKIAPQRGFIPYDGGNSNVPDDTGGFALYPIITVSYPVNASLIVRGCFTARGIVAATGTVSFQLDIDGALQTPDAVIDWDEALTLQMSVFQVWIFNITSSL